MHNELGGRHRAARPGPAGPPGPHRRRRRGGPRVYSFVADRPGTYLYEAGLAGQRPAPGRHGPARRARRAPRHRRAGLRRRLDGVRRGGGAGHERDRPGPQHQRRPGRVRHAQVHAPRYMLRQREGAPRHRPDRHRRVAARCCCATSTRGSSTTRWACSAPARPSSRWTATRWPTRGTTSPRRSDPARPRTPSWRRPAADRTARAVGLRRQPAAAQQQPRGRRRHAHLDRRAGHRRRPATPPDRSTRAVAFDGDDPDGDRRRRRPRRQST